MAARTGPPTHRSCTASGKTSSPKITMNIKGNAKLKNTEPAVNRQSACTIVAASE